MTEYIDKQKTLSTLENTAKYYEIPNADEWTKGIHYGLIHGVDNIIDNVPTADVVEREKIDKAIEEIKGQFYVLLKDEISIEESIEEIWWNNALAKTLEIIKRNIGE